MFVYSLYRRLQEIEYVVISDAMCDCVFKEVPASELSIASRAALNVDFKPLPSKVTLATVAEYAGPTNQLSSASVNISAYETLVQTLFLTLSRHIPQG